MMRADVSIHSRIDLDFMAGKNTATEAGYIHVGNDLMAEKVLPDVAYVSQSPQIRSPDLHLQSYSYLRIALLEVKTCNTLSTN